MAKQFIVARGQIEKNKEVLASVGEEYKPKNAAEEKRLLNAGVIAEVGSAKKKASAETTKSTSGSTGSAGGGGDSGSTSNTGTGGGSAGGDGDSGSTSNTGTGGGSAGGDGGAGGAA